ncbi:transposase [Bacillus cereus]|nr:transposase [Bacillus cereus]
MHRMPKNRNLTSDFCFSYIKHEQFQFLLLCVKPDRGFKNP